MGYNTYIGGEVTFDPPLTPDVLTRVREYVHPEAMREDEDFADFMKRVPYTNPAYDMVRHANPWEFADDGSSMTCEDNERPYGAEQWAHHLIDELLPHEHAATGVVYADGEDSEDFWALSFARADDRNTVTTHIGSVVFDPPVPENFDASSIEADPNAAQRRGL